MLCPGGRSAFKGGGGRRMRGEGAGVGWGGQRAASGEGVRGVMSCVRSGLEGLVISRGKSAPLGLGTLS